MLVGRVVIGMDPHKRSATLEVLDEDEQPLMPGRFGTDREGYRLLLAAGRQFGPRLWAVEGCQGVGRHVAQRLIADGETVVDVRAKAGGAGTGVLDRAGPQDRRHRRPLDRRRRAADPLTAAGWP